MQNFDTCMKPEFDNNNARHLNRLADLWWREVEKGGPEHEVGARFAAAADAEFELWAGWVTDVGQFIFWRCMPEDDRPSAPPTFLTPEELRDLHSG